jgi:hypothetical protein
VSSEGAFVRGRELRPKEQTASKPKEDGAPLRKTDNPGFRSARARLAAHALHRKRPDIAREAGRKGGKVTSERYPLGPHAFGVALAMRRWYGTQLANVGSRAPRAGVGGDEGGSPELAPATAQLVEPVVDREDARVRPRQGRLL